MRFDWVIFVVFLGYADAQPLPHNHPIVDKCYNLAVDCKHQCMANKGRHKHCVETKQKGTMRFDWVIFVVCLGYADAQPLPKDHPLVRQCMKVALACRAECLANNARQQYCVEKVCSKKGHDCMRKKGVTVV
ncbi:hypothetical protein Q1695_003853 [Nippostrongylus brasiliensis]|nr:hypothetical protein Q1695_003853 [Nippostrongylus brasiliensis]